MHKYALWAVYLFSFPLSPFDKMKVPLLRCQRGSLRSSLSLFDVSVSAMLVDTRQKNIAQAFILERYFFVSIYPAASHGTCLAVFLAAVLLLC